MFLAFMLLLQAAAAPAPAPAPAPIDFDLARYRPGEGAPVCRGGGGPAEILVCGPRRSGGAYPLAEMARRYAVRPLVAETGIARNLVGDVHGESVALDRGAVSQRAMVRLRLPF
jgi:hypothetical protein